MSKFTESKKVVNNLPSLETPENPQNLFKILNLHNAGEHIGENPTLLRWLEYVKTYRKEMGSDLAFANYQVYFTLLGTLSEEKLATLLQSLRQLPEFKSLATGVQITQYDIWLLKRNSPEDIAMKLGVKNGISALSSADPKYKIVMEYTIRYAGKLAQ